MRRSNAMKVYQVHSGRRIATVRRETFDMSAAISPADAVR
jgi:hypothetical protein